MEPQLCRNWLGNRCSEGSLTQGRVSVATSRSRRTSSIASCRSCGQGSFTDDGYSCTSSLAFCRAKKYPTRRCSLIAVYQAGRADFAHDNDQAQRTPPLMPSGFSNEGRRCDSSWRTGTRIAICTPLPVTTPFTINSHICLPRINSLPPLAVGYLQTGLAFGCRRMDSRRAPGLNTNPLPTTPRGCPMEGRLAHQGTNFTLGRGDRDRLVWTVSFSLRSC